MTTVKVIKKGNSLGFIIPTKTIKRLKLHEGAIVDITIVKKERTSALGMFKGIGGFEREEGELDRDEF